MLFVYSLSIKLTLVLSRTKSFTYSSWKIVVLHHRGHLRISQSQPNNFLNDDKEQFLFTRNCSNSIFSFTIRFNKKMCYSVFKKHMILQLKIIFLDVFCKSTLLEMYSLITTLVLYWKINSVLSSNMFEFKKLFSWKTVRSSSVLFFFK